jgi:hypothetical protein
MDTLDVFAGGAVYTTKPVVANTAKEMFKLSANKVLEAYRGIKAKNTPTPIPTR